MRSDMDESVFRQRLADATEALKARNFKQAHADITEAMGQDMDAPEPHNLLGILYEMTGDFQAARKHYRAAYALNPTYTPSCRNLERITGFESSDFFRGRVFDSAGEAPESRAKVERT